MASPDLASRRWIWEQYDQKVGADTVQRAGRRRRGGPRPRHRQGARHHHRLHAALLLCRPVSRAASRRSPRPGATSARSAPRPLAATDCMNFGNPQRPEIMGQFVGCIEGMAEACRALDFPIVSRQRPLYNETKAEDGTRQRDPADAGDRRRRPARGLAKAVDDRLQGRGRRRSSLIGDRRRPSRPVALAARDARPRGRPAAAGRPRRRARGRRFVRAADRRRRDHRRATTSRTAASPSRSPRWRWPAASARVINGPAPARLAPSLFRRGSGPSMSSPSPTIACCTFLKRAARRRRRGRGDRPRPAAAA